MWVHTGEKITCPVCTPFPPILKGTSPSHVSASLRRGNKGKGALARLAILISCFDMCSFCVAETLIHLLPLCMKRTRQVNSLQSPGGSCAMSDSSPSVICASAVCLMPQLRPCTEHTQGKEAGVAARISTERCPGNSCVHGMPVMGPRSSFPLVSTENTEGECGATGQNGIHFSETST